MENAGRRFRRERSNVRIYRRESIPRAERNEAGDVDERAIGICMPAKKRRDIIAKYTRAA